jgi:acetylglutamate kinase
MLTHAIEKAATLMEAMPYIQKFRGETVVVKFGGSIMDDEGACRNILRDIALMEIIGLRPVVVHGGGKAINRGMEARGIRTAFVNGLRVTDAASVEVVDQVLNGEINTALVRTLREFNARAVGIKGQSVLQVVRHTATDPATGAGLDWGFVGTVTRVDETIIRQLVEQDTIPVITPLGLDKAGQVHNVNADEAAGAVAKALQARKLVFLSDVPGLLRDPKDRQSIIPTLRRSEVEQLIEQGVIGGGMLPKIGGALKALESGVRKVHIIDASLPHSLLLELFTDQGVGTEIVAG